MRAGWPGCGTGGGCVMPELLDDVLYLTRADWGADSNLPRKGYTKDRNGVDIYLRKTDVALHHSVVVDNDPTPEIWETLDEIKAKCRHMQVVRPDLGNDWPYNHGGFLMPGGILCVAEGRGYNRTGAHTRGFNTVGWGFVFMGNFEAAPFVNIDPWMPAINRYFAHVKRTELPNLATIKTHRSYGHATLCPGRDIISRAHQFSLEDDQMLQELDARTKQSSVLALIAAKALAGAKITQSEKNIAIAVLNALPVTD